MKTSITKLLGIEYPIIQGGMAWVAEYHLAAAVSEAGGLGLIGAANAPAEWVREQIQKVKELTKKPFGVNIMLMSPHADEVAKVIVEEAVPVVTTGAGSPEKYMKMWKAAGVKVIPVVASVALAREWNGVEQMLLLQRERRQEAISEKIQRWFLFHKLRMQFRFRLLQLVGLQMEEVLQRYSCWERREFSWEPALLQQKKHRYMKITRTVF